MSVQPGWYPDPAEPTTQRYWDGEGWIGEPLPVDATPPPGPPAPAPEPVAEPASPAPGLVTAPPGPPPTSPGSPAAPPPSGAGFPPGAGYPSAPGYPPGVGYPGAPQPGFPPAGPVPAPPVPPTSGAPTTGAVPPNWPYPPPYGYAIPKPRPHGLALAQFGQRLVARLIDIGLVFLLNAAVQWWFVWRWWQEVLPPLREAMRRSMAGETSTEGIPQAGAQAEGLQIVILLLAVALWFAYEVPAMANSGQTVGKRVMGIKVVPLTEDQPLGFGRAFRRWNTLGGLPTFLWYCCGIGFLLQLVDCLSLLYDRPLRQALHDKRAQTVVVQVPRSSTNPQKHDVPDDRPASPGGSR